MAGVTKETLSGQCWAGIAVPTSLDVELTIKPFKQGAYASERLSFGLDGKGFREMPLLPTGLGKSDRPG